MGSPTLTNIRRFRGRVVASPTNFALAFPFGGTELGLTRNAEFIFGAQIGEITAEEYGGRWVDAVYAGEITTMAMVLRDFDADMIGSIFPNTTAVGGGKVKISNTQDDNGILLADNAIPLVFVPIADDSQELIWLPLAMPWIPATSRLQMSANVEGGIPVAFYAIPDSNGLIYEIAPKANLTAP